MKEVSFELPHTRLSALAFGQPDKPLILALHGWLDNAASFIPLCEHLQDYYVMAIDMAGHGLSAHRSADAHYHLLDFVHDLHELVKQEGWQSFILLGHSMGGIVSSLYTSCFPELVSRYITIESFGPLTKTADISAEQLRESIESRIAIREREPRHPSNMDNVVKARVKAGEMCENAARLLVSRNLQDNNGELQWRTDRRLRAISSLRVTDGQAEAFMRNIQCPVLAIAGDKGFDMMRDKLAERRSWVNNLTTYTAKGGHHVHMDTPREVADYITTFLCSK